jgi:hypothetical protein
MSARSRSEPWWGPSDRYRAECEASDDYETVYDGPDMVWRRLKYEQLMCEPPRDGQIVTGLSPRRS